MINSVNLHCSLIYLLLAGCSPSVYKTISDATYKPLDSAAEVKIYYFEENPPDSARLIGKMEIVPSFTSIVCPYNEMKSIAREEARKSGGNIVEFKEIVDPKFPNHCYSIKVNILIIGKKDTAKSFVSKSHLVPQYPEDKANGVGLYVLGGMGLGFSIEYERKLSKTYKGLGIRGGIGLAAIDITYLTIPVQINYLIGGDGSYLELGAGMTFLRNNGDDGAPNYKVFGLQLPGGQRNWFLGSATIGGRFVFEWTQNSFLALRLGFTPTFGLGQIFILPYINLDIPF